MIPASEVPGGAEVTFRRLSADDVEAVHVLHSDPATNAHNPYGASSGEDASAVMLTGWVEHWGRYGYGYELVFAVGKLVGIAGARQDIWRETPVINLYWRLLPTFQGRGLSGILAQRALQMAVQARTGQLIVARMRPENTGSVHVARRLGLWRRKDLDDMHDGFEWIMFADTAATAPRSSL